MTLFGDYSKSNLISADNNKLNKILNNDNIHTFPKDKHDSQLLNAQFTSNTSFFFNIHITGL